MNQTLSVTLSERSSAAALSPHSLARKRSDWCRNVAPTIFLLVYGLLSTQSFAQVTSPEACYEIGLQNTVDTPAANGNVYRVSNQQELSNANSQAGPGDVIEISDGTYSNWTVILTATGSAGQPIVVRPQSKWGVTLTGNSSMVIRGRHLWIEDFRFEQTNLQAMRVLTSDNRITGNVFSSCGQSGEETVRIERTTKNIEFDNNEISDAYKQSIIAFSPQPGDSNYLQPQGHNIHHNYIHDNPRRASNGGEALTTIGGTGSLQEDYKNRFEYNLIDNSDGDAEVISIKNGGWLVRYNKIQNSSGTLTLRHSANSVVQGNIIVNSKGIRVAGENNQIVANYVSVGGYAILFHHGYDGSTSYPTARNNVVSDNYFRTSSAVVYLIRKNETLIGRVSANTFSNNIFSRSTSGTWYRGGGGLADTFLDDNTWVNNNFWNDQHSYSGSDLPSGPGNENSVGTWGNDCENVRPLPPTLVTAF